MKELVIIHQLGTELGFNLDNLTLEEAAQLKAKIKLVFSLFSKV